MFSTVVDTPRGDRHEYHALTECDRGESARHDFLSFLRRKFGDANALSVFHVAFLLPKMTRREQTMFWKGLAKATCAVTNDVLQERITSLQAPDKWKEIYWAAQF